MSARVPHLLFAVAATLALSAVLPRAAFAAQAAHPGWTAPSDPIEARAKQAAAEKKVDAFTIIQRTDRYRVNISYPAIGNAVADEELAIWARDQANAFVRGVEQIPVPSPLPYELAIDYDTQVASPRVISIIFTISASTAGAQPEPGGLATFVFDRQNGRRLTYENLFLRQDGLLDALSEYCAKALREQLGEKVRPDMVKAGTAPEIANFDMFALSSQGLVIYFPPYQVAPYSEGYLRVTVPVNVLEPFKPQMFFWNKEQGR